MVIEVVENCLTNNKYGDKVHSLRSYTYESEKENFMEAIMDHENNFDIDRIITCNDDFPGECISSEVVQYKKILEANEQPVNLWDGEEEIKIDDVHVGEILENGEIKKEHYRQGFIYKNSDNYINKSGICYVPELYDNGYTYEDFINMAGGSEEVAAMLFDMVDWQSPETLLDEDLREGEIAYCENCKKMFLSYDVDNCPYCGTLKEINN